MMHAHILAWLGLLVACPSLISASCYTCGSKTTVNSYWTNNFNIKFSIPITSAVSGGWNVVLKFSKPVTNFQIWNANVKNTNSDSSRYTLKNKDWNENLNAGSTLEMDFLGQFEDPMPTITVRLIGQEDCGSCTGNYVNTTPATPDDDGNTTPTPPVVVKTTTAQPVDVNTKPAPTASGSAPYDYSKVIHKSILFYEAQRSGKLPSTNRVPWRSDSTMDDKGQNGEDLTGGWFDAGDYVKFGLPMASTVTVLSWGLIEYRDAYIAAGELDYMLDCIKWATDYFVKCHTGTNEFYGQVGKGQPDHDYWGRPEDMTFNRPAYKITANKPGSEVACETAAALAAASIAFKQTDSSYANTLLQHAKELYEFGNTHRGKYTDAIPDASIYYNSYSGFGDELAWGAAWLYRATKDAQYLQDAKAHYNNFGIGNGNPWSFSWDDKKAGVMLLLYQLTNSAGYKTAITNFLESWQPGLIDYTPKGLAFRSEWGPNRYAANTAFLALVAADAGIKPTKYRNFAKKQINYMLGDGGRSFVVGFGKNPPNSPHHRSSSCPSKPEPCDWSNYGLSGPNPHVLQGALVGGPDKSDGFVNDRTDFKRNEVACDYNAGFQSSVAGLKHLDINGLY